MKSIKDQLDILEQRMQTLIEESPTQILPFRDKRADISARMVSAMQSNIRLDESGDLVAPDLYILAVDPQTARLLAENKSITIELSEIIHQAGNESQVKFQSPPRIKIHSDHTYVFGAIDNDFRFCSRGTIRGGTCPQSPRPVSRCKGNPDRQHDCLWYFR